MTRACGLSLLLLTACAGSHRGESSGRAELRSDEVAAVASSPSVRQIALGFLLRTDTFTGASVGEGGETPYEIHALTLLLAANDPQPFQRLVREARSAGRLFGLLGLQALDERAYRAAFTALRDDQETTETFFGCIVSRRTVGELAREIDRLRQAAPAVREWWLPRDAWWAAPDPAAVEAGCTAAEWVAGLKTDPVRARAALSRLGRDALPALMAGLSANDAGVRIECAELLAALGPFGLEATPDLVKRLQLDPDPLVRTRAARALVELGPWALPAESALIAALRDPTLPLEARIAAGYALAAPVWVEGRPLEPDPLDLVELAVLDPDEHVREWGRVRLVERWPAPDAHGVAMRCVSAEPDPRLRRSLVSGLLYEHRNTQDPTTLERSSELSERLAARSVGEVDAELLTGRLEALPLDGPDPAALLALLDVPQAPLSELVSGLADFSPPALAELLQSARSPRLVALCARLLAQGHDPVAIEALTRRREGEREPRLRYLLAEALREATLPR